MLTNALGVMRTVEGLADLVRPDGLLGVMSSGQGSIGNNTRGGREVYPGSKAALNQYMRSFAARHAGEPRAMVLLAPGWIRTELGGPKATFDVEESIPKLVDVLLAQQGRPGLRFVDRDGNTVPWRGHSRRRPSTHIVAPHQVHALGLSESCARGRKRPVRYQGGDCD